jgi:hypothetical protein
LAPLTLSPLEKTGPSISGGNDGSPWAATWLPTAAPATIATPAPLVAAISGATSMPRMTMQTGHWPEGLAVDRVLVGVAI